MRLARDLGTVALLLPDGIRTITDLPYPVFSAIQNGLMYLQFEELPEDEQPPRRIWRDGEKLGAHFEDVRIRRRAKYGDGGSSSDWGRDIEDPVQNELAAELKRKAA